ncbi:MAG: SAM-dependent chlorinase/fluorinase [Intestinimonas sp.]|nr:SAM-dependent chlorinase/fluorinase [Intestinimonas sp.]
MTSTGSGFDPTAAVTRATVFQAFYNAEDKPAPQNASVLSGGVWAVDAASAYFADTTGTWYSNAANWAVDAGLANVPGDKLFHGDRTVTRAELATIIARYAESKSMDTSAGGMSMREMADYDTIPAWALHGMGVCYYNGILTGKPGDLLDPAGAVTRAELASSLMNYSKLSPSVENESTLTGTVTEVQKYGNLIMDFNPSEFLDADFAYGDVLSVTASGKTLEMPFGTSYSDVDSGSPIVRHDITNGLIVVAINMGDFSKVYGVAVGDKVSFARKEKAGYLEEYQIRNLDALRTNVRSDYASNEVFANFRPVAVGGIAEGVLYRSGSPVNNEIGRASCTDSLIRQAGVVTVVNLADSQEDLAGYFSAEDLPSSYYQSLYRAGNVCPLDMGVALMDADFSVKLKTGLEFMLDHKGPYLIHCNEGKDRAGFVSAILEALMGAGLDEIENDYMLSYENYYHVTYHSDQWYRIRSSNIVETLCTLTGAENEDALTDAALQKAAANYLTGTVGLTGQQLTALETILSTPSSIKSAA